MTAFKIVLLFSFVIPLSRGNIVDFISHLDQVTDFALDHYEEINLDGLLGFVMAEAQLLEALQMNSDYYLSGYLSFLVEKCEEIRKRVAPILPRKPKKMIILENQLLHPRKWIINKEFVRSSLANLGIYKNWTVATIINNKHAIYKGVRSDHCLMEILAENCYISPFCKEMMLSARIDTGYLLTHRLFYLQIARLKGCSFDGDKFQKFTKKFCSLILRETRTSEQLGFPSHDIVLEQIVFCGSEGYAEFLNEQWRETILSWQTPFGCYKNVDLSNAKRSSNVIAFGCSDHTTGLGAAALALNLNYELRQESLYVSE